MAISAWHRSTRGGVPGWVLLVMVAVGLFVGAVAAKEAGKEQEAGFLGVGAFVIGIWGALAGASAGSRAQAKREAGLREQYPEEPWHWKEGWHEGVVRGGARREGLTMVVFALIFMALSAPGVFAIPAELKRGNTPILLVLLFWAVGLWMLAAGWKRLRQVRRMGTLEFALEPLPGSWGGFVGGVVRIPRGAEVEEQVELKLRNLRLTVTGSGKNRRTRESVLWETESRLDPHKLRQAGRLYEVPVLFQVPRGRGGPTDEHDTQDRVVWRLEIAAPLRGGAELKTSFEIPVFDRDEDLGEGPVGSPLLRAEISRDVQDYMRAAGVTETQEGATRVWRFHQPGVRGGWWFVGGFALVCGFVAWVVPFWPIKVGFGLFGFLMAALLPGMIWQRAELRVRGREVEIRRSSLWGRRVYRVSADEVGDLTLRESMRTGEKRYLRLNLVGVVGVDPTVPHAHEHFAARKARYRARKAPDDAATVRALRETPRFEFTVADYLLGTQAAEAVRDHLLEAIIEGQ